jgi:hypothetical protein
MGTIDKARKVRRNLDTFRGVSFNCLCKKIKITLFYTLRERQSRSKETQKVSI